MIGCHTVPTHTIGLGAMNDLLMCSQDDTELGDRSGSAGQNRVSAGQLHEQFEPPDQDRNFDHPRVRNSLGSTLRRSWISPQVTPIAIAPASRAPSEDAAITGS